MTVLHKYFIVVSFLLFQSTWAATVLGRNDWIGVAIALVLLHIAVAPQRTRDLRSLFLIASLGIVADTLLVVVGVFEFAEPFFPAWLVVLWCAFALTFNYSFFWLKKLGFAWQALFGSVGGASSYMSGHFLGAVALPLGLFPSAVIVTLLWAVLFPLFFLLVKFYGLPSKSLT